MQSTDRTPAALRSLPLQRDRWIEWASLIAQLVKNPPAMQETLVQFLDQAILWRRNRLSPPVFLGFPGGSDREESACNAGDWDLIPA